MAAVEDPRTQGRSRLPFASASTEEDYVDLGETSEFKMEVMDGECSA